MTTILIVEDEFAIAELLRDTLSDEGYQVVVATDGREALELLASQQVDLILSDLMMPRMDGRTLIERLRADPRFAAIPVVVMSAGRTGLEPRFDGFDAYVSKPFNLYSLLLTIDQLLKRRP